MWEDRGSLLDIFHPTGHYIRKKLSGDGPLQKILAVRLRRVYPKHNAMLLLLYYVV